jgi:hypothetical protein
MSSTPGGGTMTEASVLGDSMPWPKIAVPVILTACSKPDFEAACAAMSSGSVTPLDYDNYNLHIKSYVDKMLSSSALPPLLAGMIRMSTMAFMSSFVSNPALGHLMRDLTSQLSANIKQLNFRPFLVRLPMALMEVFKRCAESCLPIAVHIAAAEAVGPPAAPERLIHLVPLTDDTPLSKMVRQQVASALPFSSVLFAQ